MHIYYILHNRTPACKCICMHNTCTPSCKVTWKKSAMDRSFSTPAQPGGLLCVAGRENIWWFSRCFPKVTECFEAAENGRNRERRSNGGIKDDNGDRIGT